MRLWVLDTHENNRRLDTERSRGGGGVRCGRRMTQEIGDPALNILTPALKFKKLIAPPPTVEDML